MKAMKNLRYITMTFAMIAAFSAAAFAQKDDKKPPPKEKPPVVNPAPSKPPPDSKPKKPNSEFVAVWLRETFETA